jgi:hypothetical protein
LVVVVVVVGVKVSHMDKQTPQILSSPGEEANLAERLAATHHLVEAARGGVRGVRGVAVVPAEDRLGHAEEEREVVGVAAQRGHQRVEEEAEAPGLFGVWGGIGGESKAQTEHRQDTTNI